MGDNVINIHFDDNRSRNSLTSEDGLEDKSKKGSVDEKIQDLVNKINTTTDFFTTSSCSGRIILFTHEYVNLVNVSTHDDEDSNQPSTSLNNICCIPIVKYDGMQTQRNPTKRNCHWVYVGHDEVNFPEFREIWRTVATGINTVLKFEPSILHVQCRDLTSAKKLIHVATESGFKNSGMVVGKDNKITVAVRSAIGMEVPLKKSDSDHQEEFLNELIQEANKKFGLCWSRTEKFKEKFSKTFC